MPYLNIDEVETALSVAKSPPYTSFTQLITLPNLTWEGRQCHAIKIANGSNQPSVFSRPGIFFLGGIHAREWGSSDILIHFIEQLEQAYLTNVGLTFGNRSFSAFDIQTIVNTLDIIVFPQANPDGRYHSMNADAMWRKNRRILPPNSNSGSCVGVDINRNYDFLWDFPTYFDSDAPISDSTDPCDYQVYHGPTAFSEPESKNVKWIFDTFTNIRFFIDLHSYGEQILYNWGDDDNQTIDPSMNFQNPGYNGARGITDSSGLPGASAYKEYIPSSDLSSMIDLANCLHDGIQSVRGTNYTVKPSVNLYPTAGTSDDYAYSLHFVDENKGKVFPYVLEWGPWGQFQPPYSEMQNIIQEVTAGLLAYCLCIRPSLLIEKEDLSKWAAVLIAIFGGATQDGGGWGVFPSGRPLPIPPGPDPLMRLSKHKQDILIGLAVTEIASIINSPQSKIEIEKVGIDLMSKAIEELRHGQ
jgi:carboxypeptidase T